VAAITHKWGWTSWRGHWQEGALGDDPKEDKGKDYGKDEGQMDFSLSLP